MISWSIEFILRYCFLGESRCDLNFFRLGPKSALSAGERVIADRRRRCEERFKGPDETGTPNEARSCELSNQAVSCSSTRFLMLSLSALSLLSRFCEPIAADDRE